MSKFNKIYRNVPLSQRERLVEFRKAHPYRHLNVGELNWKYIMGGTGPQVVLLLPGSVRSAEVWAKLMPYLEKDYRIISPTYPAIRSLDEGAKGIYGILKAEKADKVFIIGSSFGGWLAQVFIRKYPRLVSKFILSNTSGPGSVMSDRLLEYTRVSLPKYPEKILKLIYRRSYLKILSGVKKEEKAFWKAFMTELLYDGTSREDILNQFKAIYDYVKNYRFNEDDLKNWKGRILIIESSDDIMKEEGREELKNLYPKAEVKTIIDAGHTPGYTAHPAYLRAVIKFLSGEK